MRGPTSRHSSRTLERGTTVAVAAAILLATCKGSTEPAAVATSVEVWPSSATLATLSSTRQFTSTVFDQRGDSIRGATVVWSSTAPGVLAVSATGLATAEANGTAQIVATSGSVAGHADVTVAQSVSQIAKPRDQTR